MASSLNSPALAALPAYFNLRDLGRLETAEGLRLKEGRLFRGASLHRLEGDDLTAVASLGIRTAIDLRTTTEIGGGTYAGDSAVVHHLPVFERTPTFKDPIEDIPAELAAAYLWMLDQGGDAIAAGLRLLGDPENLPAVVYCAAGKDRTGVFCAIVLHLVGVGHDEIVADYALSDAPAQALREWRAALDPTLRDPVPAGIYRAPEGALRLFFTAVEGKFGSIENYLAEVGVPVEKTRAALIANLVEPAATAAA